MRIIRTIKAQAFLTDTIYIGERRRRRAGSQKLEDLREHNTDIVGVGLIDIANLWTAVNPADPVPLEEIEVEIFTIEDRTEIVVEPTVITALFIAIIPMRTTNLAADTAQAPITRARNLVCYQALPSPLVVFVHSDSSRGELCNTDLIKNPVAEILKGFFNKSLELLLSCFLNV